MITCPLCQLPCIDTGKFYKYSCRTCLFAVAIYSAKTITLIKFDSFILAVDFFQNGERALYLVQKGQTLYTSTIDFNLDVSSKSALEQQLKLLLVFQ